MTCLAPPPRRVRAFADRLRRLLRCESGVALIEFAYSMPLLLGLGLAAVEIGNMATTRLRVSQIALSLADNASRLGQTENNGVTPTVREADLDALIDGALLQGESIDLEGRGRIIISSLEWNEFRERQFIHWQRCRGDLEAESAYGDDGNNNGLGQEELEGMGRGDSQLVAPPDSAVMFVEIYYDYEPLMDWPLGDAGRFVQEAGFIIRDDRNLDPGLTGGGTRSSCNT